MATFKQLTDQFIADLKALAKDEEQLAQWYAMAASRLAARHQRIQQAVTADVQSFIAAKKAEWEAHRKACCAERAANGEPEE